MGRLAAIALTMFAAFLVPVAANARPERHWIASWASAQQIPESHNALDSAQLTDATLRQIVHLSAGGARLRIRLSNLHGSEPLTIDAAHAARAIRSGHPAILPDTDTPLHFGGASSVTIPAGEEVFSDPVTLSMLPGSDLAVSIYLARPPARQTSHPGARATSYLVHGNHVGDETLTDPATTEHWFQLSAVDVAAAPGAATIVAIGDSITDGHGSGTDRNTRWPDYLAGRVRRIAGQRQLGVVNTGIGGNRVLEYGLGPKMVERFHRDTAGLSGARYVIMLEGVNDLGVLTRDRAVPQSRHDAMVRDIVAAYREVAADAHAAGLKMIAGTIMPFAGNDYYHPGPATEADRQKINAFIRTSDIFDAVVDFDAVMRDPERPDRLNPAYDSGDGLHPSDRGYRAMAAAIPLSLFAEPEIAKPDRPAIAVTFDDLPAHGPLPPGVDRLDVVNDIIAALKAHGVRKPHGFLNGGFGIDDPQSPGVVAAWRSAGFPLGNHSYSHWNLAEKPLAAFQQDVLRNESVLAAATGNSDWHWFRYPFLSEGDTPDRRGAFRDFLRRRGYRVAAVTMSFGDYAWNPAYARCRAKGDDTAVAALERSYLDAARAEAEYERRAAQAALGRDIPYILLMHLGAFDAHMLPRLLDLYEQMGFRFTSLAAAERDPFYRSAVDLRLPGPSATLSAAVADRAITLPAPPHPDLSGTCAG
ncbi:GDSL-type esterase/lipase family protein [Stakelama saccharophila]|uniref:Chitooligosaccharide deacetylase n=1 Tax=Stakelama saccharophila TaxID=3075605 RepID=A0ABZ0B4Z8_9SPHN|nr:GDSL-type esterase/lipase family protein [Stakelama sp. W311]WNO52368.1 GDSL-type esterase/lipase family protein [Stakelama sp. W311]